MSDPRDLAEAARQAAAKKAREIAAEAAAKAPPKPAKAPAKPQTVPPRPGRDLVVPSPPRLFALPVANSSPALPPGSSPAGSPSPPLFRP